jgi:protein farnesyltransferase/geranylgeranyltransferase type-1 subunit alpha
MFLPGITFEGEPRNRTIANGRLLKELDTTYTSILPAIQIYTGQPADSTESASDLPLPSDPLPEDTPLPISHAVEFLADAYVEQKRVDEAKALYADLGEKHDRIRAAYWDYRKSAL